MKGFCAIVLEEAPRKRVQIDLWQMSGKVNFRGFENVPPGLHYAAVKYEGRMTGFWHFLKPGKAVVRLFDNGIFTTIDDPDVHLVAQQALKGKLHHAMVPYPMQHLKDWTALTAHVRDGMPPAASDLAVDNPQFLPALQFAFVQWLIEGMPSASKRWVKLLEQAADADPASHQTLFTRLTPALINQLKQDIEPGDRALTLVGTIADKLAAAQKMELQMMGKQFQAFLEQ